MLSFGSVILMMSSAGCSPAGTVRLSGRVVVAVGFACQYGNFTKQLMQIAMPRRQWQKQSRET